MKSYDEIVDHVLEATAEHHRRRRRVQQIVSASLMCAVCAFGLTVFLRLEPHEMIQETTEPTFHSTTVRGDGNTLQPSLGGTDAQEQTPSGTPEIQPAETGENPSHAVTEPYQDPTEPAFSESSTDGTWITGTSATESAGSEESVPVSSSVTEDNSIAFPETTVPPGTESAESPQETFNSGYTTRPPMTTSPVQTTVGEFEDSTTIGTTEGSEAEPSTSEEDEVVDSPEYTETTEEALQTTMIATEPETTAQATEATAMTTTTTTTTTNAAAAGTGTTTFTTTVPLSAMPINREED